MTWGIQTFAADGRVTFDSGAHAGGAMVDLLVVPASPQTGSKSYPALVGRSLVLVQDQFGPHAFSTGTPGGVPTVYWAKPDDPYSTYPNTPSRVLVFAR